MGTRSIVILEKIKNKVAVYDCYFIFFKNFDIIIIEKKSKGDNNYEQ